jgi:hypothetical protein
MGRRELATEGETIEGPHAKFLSEKGEHIQWLLAVLKIKSMSVNVVVEPEEDGVVNLAKKGDNEG